METSYIDLEDSNLFPSLEISNEQNNINEDLCFNLIDNNCKTPFNLTSNDAMLKLSEETTLNDLNVIDEVMQNYELNSNKICEEKDYDKKINDFKDYVDILSELDNDMNNIPKRTTPLNTKSSCSDLNCWENTAVQLISDMKIKIIGPGIANYKNYQEDCNTKKKIKNVNKATKINSKKLRKIRKNLRGKTVREIKQNEETETCIDVITVPKETPILEANDVNSLLEQFEAYEISTVNALCHNDISTQPDQRTEVQPILIKSFSKQTSPVLSRNTSSSVFSRKKNSSAEFEITNSSVHSANVNSAVILKKQKSLSPNLIKDINDPASKEVINRIKALNKESKRGISVIPAMPNIRKREQNNDSRAKDTNAGLSKHIAVKEANEMNNKKVVRGSIQLHNDYCSNSNSTVNSSHNSVNEKKASDNSEKTQSLNNKSRKLNRSSPVKNKTKTVIQVKSFTESEKNNVHKNFIKDYSLELAKKINNSEKLCNSKNINTDEKQTNKQTQERPKITQSPKQDSKSSLDCIFQANVSRPLVVDMRIQSAIVEKILRSKNKRINNQKSIRDNNKQMISVLKKQRTVQLPIQPITTNNNKRIDTTNNSSNNIVQNILIENIQETRTKIETKQPSRRKLSLAEYRNRRGNTIAAARLPVKSLSIVNIYTASTTTEPFKDHLGNELWCERECWPQKKFETDLYKPKPPTQNIGTQTYQTLFNYGKRCYMDIIKENETLIKSQVGVDDKTIISTKSSIVIDKDNEVSAKSFINACKKNEKKPSSKRILEIEEKLTTKKRKVDSSSRRSTS